MQESLDWVIYVVIYWSCYTTYIIVCVYVCYIYIYIYKIYKNNMVFKCKYVRINILSNISSVTFSNVIDGIMED